MPTRLVHVLARDRLDLLVQHIRLLTKAGESVLLVTANQPASVLLPKLDQAGVDPHMVHVIDTLGDGPAIRTHDKRTHIVPSPAMLELIGLRAKRILRSHPGRTRIVVNDCDAFALYNPATTLSEYLRFILHRHGGKLRIDFILHTGTTLDKDLLTMLKTSVDEEVRLYPLAPSH